MCEDRQGTLWLATHEGLVIFDPETETFQWAQHDSRNPASISSEALTSIFRDRSDAIWIGTAGFGLNRCDAHGRLFHTYNPKNLGMRSDDDLSIYALLEDRRGILWIFANQKLQQLERKTGRLLPDPLNRTLGPVHALYEDRQGLFWITDNDGVFHYDSRAGKMEKIIGLPEASNLLMYAIYEDHDGDMWFSNASSTEYGVVISPEERFALYHWRRKTGAMAEYPLPVPPSLIRDGLEVRRIVQNQSGVFWLATSRGLFRFEPRRTSVQRGALKIFQYDANNPVSLTNNNVKTLLIDPLHPDRFLWLGTDGGGLNRFDFAAEEFSHYTEAQGLPNNVVYGILADGVGNLWLSTNKGLSNAITAPDTREITRFKNYDVGDGLQSNEFNTDAYFKNAGGEMFFGGIKGLTVFHPDSIKDNPYIPPVMITDLQINYQSVKLGQPGSPLQKSINTTETITLAPEDNVVTFEFAALDYSAPEKNLYSYKLEGFEENWSHPSRNRRATYTDLEPGEYVLRVKGANNDGVWNEAGAAIKLIVMPPWWKTWWAYALYGMIFFGAFYGLRRYEMNRMLWKNRVTLERLESDKVRELDRLKSRFFANISHEFRTPLTLVMGQLESMKAAAAEAMLKTKLDMAWRNAQQLLRLINQLLDLSKLEAGRMELRAAYGNIVPLLQRLTSSFESLASLKRIQLRFSSTHEEIRIYHEPEKIEKIMHNLLSNAFKFTPEGGKISVQLSVTSDQLPVISKQSSVTSKQSSLITDHCLLITIRDSGIGIPQEHLPRVFDRFYQVDSSATREHEGTGIGLALTKELVELHGGEISVTSEEGFGTTFVVRLPFSEIRDSDQSPVISEQVGSLQVASEQDAEFSNEAPATSHQQRATSHQRQGSHSDRRRQCRHALLLARESGRSLSGLGGRPRRGRFGQSAGAGSGFGDHRCDDAENGWLYLQQASQVG
jgi:signal transduction histidine kinase/streptogramin lyase